jgi:tetratricopeptide (TPR) repeat protein
MALKGLGNLLARRGAPDDEWYRTTYEGLGVLERVWGAEHTDVAACCSDFADILNLQGRTAEAEPLLRRAMAIWTKLFGENNRFAPESMVRLGFLNFRQDRLPEAEAWYRKSLALQAASSSGEIWNGDRMDATSNLGVCLYHEGRLAEAEEILRQSDREWRKHRGLEHPRYHWLLSNLGSLLLDRGKLHEADSLLAESLRLQGQFAPKGTPNKWRPWTQNARGAIAALEGRHAAADSLFRISAPLAWTITGLPIGSRRIAHDRYERYRTSRGKAIH